jgi:hypothetical protein
MAKTINRDSLRQRWPAIMRHQIGHNLLKRNAVQRVIGLRVWLLGHVFFIRL